MKFFVLSNSVMEDSMSIFFDGATTLSPLLKTNHFTSSFSQSFKVSTNHMLSFCVCSPLQLGGKNQQGVERQAMPLKQCVAMVKDVFTSAAERDIYTGDSIIISVVTKEGTKSEQFPLRKD